MNNSDGSFEYSIDHRCPAERSIVLRYKDHFSFGSTPDEDAQFKRWLEKTSIREGARIFPLFSHRGVDVHVLDETSAMHTGTLKSTDGCITIAKCKSRGHERIVFESGANTGTALTEYGVNAGLETFFFLPEENVLLLRQKTFASPMAHLISVDHPGRVKRAARLFARLNNIRHVPETGWRYEASRFRGCFVLEHVLTHGAFDWVTQSISAAFGPIGIYSVLARWQKQAGKLPRFLGVQQKANCPMYRAWKANSREVTPMPVHSTGNLLTKSMYDFAPHTYGTFQDLMELLDDTQGELTTVTHNEFFDFLDRSFEGSTIAEVLGANGINVGNKIVETTGLMCLAGTFKEIERGTIPRGARILCCLTSGTQTADGQAQPERRIASARLVPA
ncbi:MAG TPA: pyridoxal-phosphate dependent enzyme [Terriglobales bacterium]|nr:pyridoxal-phosphate dependent enzyme [Terriglobales bacterium]